MHTQLRRQIGERLKKARLMAGLTQQDVAADFHVSRQAVSSWESGKTLPDLVELRDLATLYGVTTDRIVRGVDDSEDEGRRLLAHISSSALPGVETAVAST